MFKNLAIAFLAVMAISSIKVAEAQQRTKISRIGYLSPGLSSNAPQRIEAFLQGLRELGYVEGQNIMIEHRFAEGKQDRYPVLMAELVRLKVDAIVTHGSTGTRSAMEATSTIPIVMANDPDPVGSGFVASLARPGGNVTGLSALAPELSGKRLELLKEILPKLSRVAVLGTEGHPGNAQNLRETELAAQALNVTLHHLEVVSPKDIKTVFQVIANRGAGAMIALGSFVQVNQRTQIASLAAEIRLPAMYPQSEFVDAGGLMSYGVNRNDMAHRAASFVDRILKQVKPGHLPVEQATKFEFVINLNTAKQIGLKIPPNVLARADRVIR